MEVLQFHFTKRRKDLWMGGSTPTDILVFISNQGAFLCYKLHMPFELQVILAKSCNGTFFFF